MPLHLHVHSAALYCWTSCTTRYREAGVVSTACLTPRDERQKDWPDKRSEALSELLVELHPLKMTPKDNEMIHLKVYVRMFKTVQKVPCMLTICCVYSHANWPSLHVGVALLVDWLRTEWCCCTLLQTQTFE